MSKATPRGWKKLKVKKRGEIGKRLKLIKSDMHSSGAGR